MESDGELLYLWDLSDSSQGPLGMLFISFSLMLPRCEHLILWDIAAASHEFSSPGFTRPAVDYFRRDGDAWRSFTGLALEESPLAFVGARASFLRPEGLRWGEHRLRRGDLVILEQINEQRLEAL